MTQSPSPEASAPPSNLLWTAAQVEALTTMWAAHAAPAQIAADLNELYGTTRTEGAIRTKAMHLGLPRLGVRTRRSTEAAKVIALAAPAPAPVVEEVAAPVVMPVSAPTERPRGVLLQDLSPYCTEHRRICTSPDRKGVRQPYYPGWPRPDAPAGKLKLGNVPRGGR